MYLLQKVINSICAAVGEIGMLSEIWLLQWHAAKYCTWIVRKYLQKVNILAI